jgi:hypothetical protein
MHFSLCVTTCEQWWAGVQALMPPEDMAQEAFGCPFQTISRLYELLAQVCAALGLNSVSALFYSLSVQSVMHLSPSHVLEDQLDPLSPGTAPLTVSRYLSSTLNHLATELITAADYPAALRALVFSRKVCTHELLALEGNPVYEIGVPPGRASQRDSDTNEARALLTYCSAQLAATILELRSRYGISEYHVEGPVCFALLCACTCPCTSLLSLKVPYGHLYTSHAQQLGVSQPGLLRCRILTHTTCTAALSNALEFFLMHCLTQAGMLHHRDWLSL